MMLEINCNDEDEEVLLYMKHLMNKDDVGEVVASCIGFVEKLIKDDRLKLIVENDDGTTNLINKRELLIDE